MPELALPPVPILLPLIAEVWVIQLLDILQLFHAGPTLVLGPQPAMLLLPLDFGTPGLHGKHSVGHLEGVYMVCQTVLFALWLLPTDARMDCSGISTACRPSG